MRVNKAKVQRTEHNQLIIYSQKCRELTFTISDAILKQDYDRALEASNDLREEIDALHGVWNRVLTD